MKLKEFLKEMQKQLDTAWAEYEIGNEAMCMFHLGFLCGMILKFIESEDRDKNESKKTSVAAS